MSDAFLFYATNKHLLFFFFSGNVCVFVSARSIVHMSQTTACRSQFSPTMLQELNSGPMSASGLLYICTCTCAYTNMFINTNIHFC